MQSPKFFEVLAPRLVSSRSEEPDVNPELWTYILLPAVWRYG